MGNDEFYMDPKLRFSSRVENYVKYRPGYPLAIIDFLKEKKILLNNSIVADIGSGTGILSELLLRSGYKVYGIEPNTDMRKTAEQLLCNYENFISVNGTAENTTLSGESVNVITAGQAFHWFDVEKAKIEFKRILKPLGYVVLIWNNRKKLKQGFPEDYELFALKYGKDYKEIKKREKYTENFFEYSKKIFQHHQFVNYEGFIGRILSASYIPLQDEPIFEEMVAEIKVLFNKYQENGLIKLEYDTEVYFSHL